MRKFNQEKEQDLESLMAYFFLAVSLMTAGIFMISLSSRDIAYESMYAIMDQMWSVNFWGVGFILSGILIILAILSSTIKKYYLNILGGAVGFVLSGMMSMIGISVNADFFIPFFMAVIAFFSLTMIVFSGVCIWREKRKIHM